MTRKKEIEQAAWNYIDSKNVKSGNEQLAFGDFINGAEWSDKTILDKVCKVIEEMLPNYVELNYVFDEISVNYHKFKNNFISDLRKAIEENKL